MLERDESKLIIVNILPSMLIPFRSMLRIWITIDDTDVEMIRMMSIRHFGAENGQGLFLGGLPSGHDAIEIIKNSQSLQGTIKNLIYNGKIIIFSDFVASLGVEIGKDTAI